MLEMLGLYHCHNPDNLTIFVPCFGYGSRVRLGVYYHMYNHKLGLHDVARTFWERQQLTSSSCPTSQS
jgi:hypothetical protein